MLILSFIFYNLFYNFKGHQTETNDEYMTFVSRLYSNATWYSASYAKFSEKVTFLLPDTLMGLFLN